MTGAHPYEGTLPGLAQLLTETFEFVQPQFEEGAAGDTIVITFDNNVSDAAINTVANFLEEHGARYTRLNTDGSNQRYDGLRSRTIIRAIMDDTDPSWNLTPDIAVQYTIAIDDEHTLTNPDIDPAAVLMNSPAYRSPTGEITSPEYGDNINVNPGFITSIVPTTYQTMRPQPPSKKHPPAVTITTPETTADNETRTFEHYDKITATHDSVIVEDNGSKTILENGVITTVEPTTPTTQQKDTTYGTKVTVEDAEEAVDDPLSLRPELTI